jgi:predicted transcriptional regulator
MPAVSGECETAEVLELLNDEYARTILTATSAEPMSANSLSERCDASPSTIYRRLDRLRECGLVDEQLQPQPDGNHYKVYAAQLEEFAVSFEDGEMHAEMELGAEDPADRFTRMWEEL